MNDAVVIPPAEEQQVLALPLKPTPVLVAQPPTPSTGERPPPHILQVYVFRFSERQKHMFDQRSVLQGRPAAHWLHM